MYTPQPNRLFPSQCRLATPRTPALALTLDTLAPTDAYVLARLPAHAGMPGGGYLLVLRADSEADAIAAAYAAHLVGEPRTLLARAIGITPEQIGTGGGWWGDGDRPVSWEAIHALEAAGRLMPWPHGQ